MALQPSARSVSEAHSKSVCNRFTEFLDLEPGSAQARVSLLSLAWAFPARAKCMTDPSLAHFVADEHELQAGRTQDVRRPGTATDH